MNEFNHNIYNGAACCVCFAPMVGHGYIQSCACCNSEQKLAEEVEQIACPLCCKRVRVGGIADHINDVHGVISSDTSVLYY